MKVREVVIALDRELASFSEQLTRIRADLLACIVPHGRYISQKEKAEAILRSPRVRAFAKKVTPKLDKKTSGRALRIPVKLRPGRLFKTTKKGRPAIKGIIRRINSGGKTMRMLAVLADGKVHKATELALAAGTRSGAVHTHLNARVKNGEIKKTGPGLFRLNGRKKKAA